MYLSPFITIDVKNTFMAISLLRSNIFVNIERDLVAIELFQESEHKRPKRPSGIVHRQRERNENLMRCRRRWSVGPRDVVWINGRGRNGRAETINGTWQGRGGGGRALFFRLDPANNKKRKGENTTGRNERGRKRNNSGEAWNFLRTRLPTLSREKRISFKSRKMVQVKIRTHSGKKSLPFDPRFRKNSFP